MKALQVMPLSSAVRRVIKDIANEAPQFSISAHMTSLPVLVTNARDGRDADQMRSPSDRVTKQLCPHVPPRRPGLRGASPDASSQTRLMV